MFNKINFLNKLWFIIELIIKRSVNECKYLVLYYTSFLITLFNTLGVLIKTSKYYLKNKKQSFF